MIPYPPVPNELLFRKTGIVSLKTWLTTATGFAILWTRLSLFLKEDDSDPNSTHSSTMVAKLINISIPTILWSFDTISVSTSSV